MEHEFWVYVSKSWGLIYLILLSIGVLVYALRPSNKNTFDKAANSVLDEKDRPWQ